MTKKYFGTDGIRGLVNSKHINGEILKLSVLKVIKEKIVDNKKKIKE